MKKQAKMRSICIAILFLSGFWARAQDVNSIILDKMIKLPIFIKDLNFHYIGEGTVNGIEIRYYHKKNNKCDAHLFFVNDYTLEVRDHSLSLKDFLIKSAAKYHYMKYSNYASFFGCEYNDIDSFSLCNDEDLYSRTVLQLSENAVFYQVDNDFFTVAEVKAEVFKFVSNDVKYTPFFYHLLNSSQHFTQIEKIIYKNIIHRKYYKFESLFKGKPLNKSVSCISIYD